MISVPGTIWCHLKTEETPGGKKKKKRNTCWEGCLSCCGSPSPRLWLCLTHPLNGVCPALDPSSTLVTFYLWGFYQRHCFHLILTSKIWCWQKLLTIRYRQKHKTQERMDAQTCGQSIARAPRLQGHIPFPTWCFPSVKAEWRHTQAKAWDTWSCTRLHAEPHWPQFRSFRTCSSRYDSFWIQISQE